MPTGRDFKAGRKALTSLSTRLQSGVESYALVVAAAVVVIVLVVW